MAWAGVVTEALSDAAAGGQVGSGWQQSRAGLMHGAAFTWLAGVAGAVLLPATGVTVGLVQVARGVVNQPEAVLESIRGKVWDKVRAVAVVHYCRCPFFLVYAHTPIF